MNTITPIKVRISESVANSNWQDEPDEYIVVNNAQLSPNSKPIQYVLDCYGAKPFITNLYFDTIGQAYSTWVKLKTLTECNNRISLKEYNYSNNEEVVGKFKYEEAIEYVLTKEKFKYI